MTLGLRVRHAVVVGSSGGIGAALCRGLADGGAQVHALSRNGSTPDPRVTHGRIDIEDEASIAHAASLIFDPEPLDLVIVASGLLHSAAVAPEKSYRQLSAASLERYFAVNATGPALVAKHFLPLLRKDRPAVFAALSARVGSIGDNRLGGWHGYRASKAALNMIIKNLAIEIARTRPETICVALHPGTVATSLSEPFQRAVPADRLFSAKVSANHLLGVVTRLSPSQSGQILAWDGAVITP
jgi:NAD(P)-dependent dehydrogenase (short-subunit alcohol dehydrogenase family)